MRTIQWPGFTYRKYYVIKTTEFNIEQNTYCSQKKMNCCNSWCQNYSLVSTVTIQIGFYLLPIGIGETGYIYFWFWLKLVKMFFVGVMLIFNLVIFLVCVRFADSQNCFTESTGCQILGGVFNGIFGIAACEAACCANAACTSYDIGKHFLF